MRYVGGFNFLTLALMACSVHADTIPTLVATDAYLSWDTTHASQDSFIAGADFRFGAAYAGPPINVPYPCSLPPPSGGCVAPGPALSINWPFPLQGSVTLGGTRYSADFVGSPQIQYLTPTIAYPDPTPTGNVVNIPVLLTGSETAYWDVYPPLTTVLANISINLPGTLTLYSIEFQPGQVYTGASFTSTPVPEPGSVALACLGFLLLVTTAYKGHRRPDLP